MAQYHPTILPDRPVEEMLPSPWNTDGLYRDGEGEEAGEESEAQSHLWLHSKFEASLGYIFKIKIKEISRKIKKNYPTIVFLVLL